MLKTNKLSNPSRAVVVLRLNFPHREIFLLFMGAMKKIDEKLIQKIADLAMIKLSDNEIDKYTKELSGILEYVEIINEVNIEGCDFISQTDLKNVWREDVVKESLTQEDVLSGSKSFEGCFVVPRVVE